MVFQQADARCRQWRETCLPALPAHQHLRRQIVLIGTLIRRVAYSYTCEWHRAPCLPVAMPWQGDWLFNWLRGDQATLKQQREIFIQLHDTTYFLKGRLQKGD